MAIQIPHQPSVRFLGTISLFVSHIQTTSKLIGSERGSKQMRDMFLKDYQNQEGPSWRPNFTSLNWTFMVLFAKTDEPRSVT